MRSCIPRYDTSVTKWLRYHRPVEVRPVHLELKRDESLTVDWSDGVRSVYSIAHLRRFSPSADARHLREQMASNPLTVLPPSRGDGGPLRALDIERVGHYAVRIRFSDGHDTGIYSWPYLRSIDPALPATPAPHDRRS